MTVDELRATEEAFITPKVAAKFLGCSPQLIRQMAKDELNCRGAALLVIKKGAIYETQTRTI